MRDILISFARNGFTIHPGKLAMKILSLSTDPELSLFRKRVLETAGHEVMALSTEKEVLEQAAEPWQFDVVLVCHRLPDATARKAIRLLRDNRPQAKVVYVVHLYGEWPEVEADRYVVGADGPDALVRVVSEVVSQAAS
jgi:DNA-binding response OmpR family regulator